MLVEFWTIQVRLFSFGIYGLVMDIFNFVVVLCPLAVLYYLQYYKQRPYAVRWGFLIGAALTSVLIIVIFLIEIYWVCHGQEFCGLYSALRFPVGIYYLLVGVIIAIVKRHYRPTVMPEQLAPEQKDNAPSLSRRIKSILSILFFICIIAGNIFLLDKNNVWEGNVDELWWPFMVLNIPYLIWLSWYIFSSWRKQRTATMVMLSLWFILTMGTSITARKIYIGPTPFFGPLLYSSFVAIVLERIGLRWMYHSQSDQQPLNRTARKTVVILGTLAILLIAQITWSAIAPLDRTRVGDGFIPRAGCALQSNIIKKCHVTKRATICTEYGTKNSHTDKSLQQITTSSATNIVDPCYYSDYCRCETFDF